MQKPKTAATALLGRRRIARTRELEAAGLSRPQLTSLRRAGVITRVSRGLYTLPGNRRPGSLALAAERVPRGVVCLISALQFHGITTQLPSQTWIAIGGDDWRPVQRDAHLRIVRFSPAALREGVETHEVDGVSVPIFNPAKTVADCFKYRNKIGLDIPLEALREGLRQRTCTVDDLMRYAKVDRVAVVMRPYLEALA